MSAGHPAPPDLTLCALSAARSSALLSLPKGGVAMPDQVVMW